MKAGLRLFSASVRTLFCSTIVGYKRCSRVRTRGKKHTPGIPIQAGEEAVETGWHWYDGQRWVRADPPGRR